MAKKSSNSRDFWLDDVAQTVAQQEPEMVPYTELRGRIYWFRRRAPEPLKPGAQLLLEDTEASVGKNGYVRFSLKTSDRSEAAKAARRFAHLLDVAAERRGNLKALRINEAPASQKPTREEIQHAAETMYAQLLGADEDTAERSLAAALGGEDADEIREPDRFTWSSADLPQPSTAGQVELLKKFSNVFSLFLFTSTGKTIQEITPDLLPFADAFRRYVNALERRKSSEVVPTPPLPATNSLWSWDDAFNYYVEQRPGLADSSKSNYRTAWNTLAESAKCLPGKLTTEAVVKWRDGLLKKLEPPTVKSRLTFAGAIWRESRVNGKIDRATINPFEGLRVKVDANVGTAREEFTLPELRKIFSVPPLQTARAVSAHAGYWLPLLALYHGARLEELTGLEVVDIEDWDLGLVLHIRENTIRPRLKHRKRSERSIPVHPKVLELGFKEYVASARIATSAALFPSFSRGATFGEEFVQHVKGLLSPEPGRLVGMHCFRHSWETARRSSRMDTSASNYITGRRIDDGSAALYGGPAGLATLADELSKISYDLKFLPAPAITPAELKAQQQQCQRARRGKATSATKV
jgi:integrase